MVSTWLILDKLEVKDDQNKSLSLLLRVRGINSDSVQAVHSIILVKD